MGSFIKDPRYPLGYDYEIERLLKKAKQCEEKGKFEKAKIYRFRAEILMSKKNLDKFIKY